MEAQQGNDRPARLGELGPLPGGHHGLSREQILDSQRERLLAAIVQVVAERGYRATTLAVVGKQASVSNRHFYANFDGKEDCFLAAFDAVRDHLEEVIASAAEEQPDWPHQLIAALRAALELFAAKPELARFTLLESVSATPTVAIHFREAVLACEPALARGRAELPDEGESLLPKTEDSLLGGILSLTTRAVISGETKKLPALLPDLAEFALTPYVGPERAAELAAEAAAG
jgi:AcrR family transcriptional regulator